MFGLGGPVADFRLDRFLITGNVQPDGGACFKLLEQVVRNVESRVKPTFGADHEHRFSGSDPLAWLGIGILYPPVFGANNGCLFQVPFERGLRLEQGLDFGREGFDGSRALADPGSCESVLEGPEGFLAPGVFAGGPVELAFGDCGLVEKLPGPLILGLGVGKGGCRLSDLSLDDREVFRSFPLLSVCETMASPFDPRADFGELRFFNHAIQLGEEIPFVDKVAFPDRTRCELAASRA